MRLIAHRVLDIQPYAVGLAVSADPQNVKLPRADSLARSQAGAHMRVRMDDALVRRADPAAGALHRADIVYRHTISGVITAIRIPAVRTVT